MGCKRISGVFLLKFHFGAARLNKEVGRDGCRRYRARECRLLYKQGGLRLLRRPFWDGVFCVRTKDTDGKEDWL